MGGLPRRATFIDEKQAQGSVFIVDAGAAFWRSAQLPKNREDELKLKASIMAEGYALSGIDAMGIAPGDLSIGIEGIRDLAQKHSLPYVAANLTCGGSELFPGSKVVEKDGHKLGFVGVYISKEDIQGCEISDPIASAAAAVQALPADLDAVVVLGNFDEEKAKMLAEASPAVSFIVTAGSMTFDSGRPLTQSTWLLGSGSRGKKAGYVQATMVDGGVGWQSTDPGGDQAKKIDRFRKRIKETEGRLEKVSGDEKLQARLERQLSFYQKEVTKLEAEIKELTSARPVPGNIFENQLVSLAQFMKEKDEVVAMLASHREQLDAFEKKASDAKHIQPMVRGDMPGAKKLLPGPTHPAVAPKQAPE